MSFSGAVEWWQEWKLRVLVLASLFMQYLLYFSLWLRKSPYLRRLRVLVWVVYVGSDAVAIYALATLFNRQKQTPEGESTTLEVLWAPVLLIHLGGQPFISAYSLEDNELWKRHTITVVSQVTVALYVFCKWWSGEKSLLAAAVLLFLFGIVKFAQKPWALKAASFKSLQGSSSAPLPQSIHTLEEYVQAAKKCTKVTEQSRAIWSNSMFVDQSASYSARLEKLSFFLSTKHDRWFNWLQDCLGSTFITLYTRLESFDSIPGSVGLMFLLPFLALCSIVLFATSRKDGQNKNDIRVTYILFCCTTFLEFLLPCIGFSLLVPCSRSFYRHIDSSSLLEPLYMWHSIVSQHNIMSFCVRKKRPTFLMKLATLRFLRKFVNQQWYIQQAPTAFVITQTVFQHVLDGWKNYIHDAASYRRFNELRGQWAVRRHHQLGWSLKKPFDESILIWHIAVDLCFYHPNTSNQCREEEATQRSREISNYMIYLLLICPEMVIPGTRSGLFTLACDEIVRNIKRPLDITEEILAWELLNMPTPPTATGGREEEVGMALDACKLAKQLMQLENEKKRWTVIQGVWVEMLCYSASRCRGYLHAKSLGEGGEYLSYVWLLWSFMGMETMADRQQRSEPPQEEGQEEEEEEEITVTRLPSLGGPLLDRWNFIFEEIYR